MREIRAHRALAMVCPVVSVPPMNMTLNSACSLSSDSGCPV